MSNLLKVGESGLHNRINRRGKIQQAFQSSSKTHTKQTKGKEKFLLHRFFLNKKVRARGTDKFR